MFLGYCSLQFYCVRYTCQDLALANDRLTWSTTLASWAVSPPTRALASQHPTTPTAPRRSSFTWPRACTCTPKRTRSKRSAVAIALICDSNRKQSRCLRFSTNIFQLKLSGLCMYMHMNITVVLRVKNIVGFPLTAASPWQRRGSDHLVGAHT